MDLLAGFMHHFQSRHYFMSLPQPVIENKSHQILPGSTFLDVWANVNGASLSSGRT